jgi:hypothetical protein
VDFVKKIMIALAREQKVAKIWVTRSYHTLHAAEAVICPPSSKEFAGPFCFSHPHRIHPIPMLTEARPISRWWTELTRGPGHRGSRDETWPGSTAYQTGGKLGSPVATGLISQKENDKDSFFIPFPFYYSFSSSSSSKPITGWMGISGRMTG